MLKKLNVLFLFIVSFLLFLTQYNSFNKSYSDEIYTPSWTYVINHSDTSIIGVPVEMNRHSEIESASDYLVSIIESANETATISQIIPAEVNDYNTMKTYIFGSIKIAAEGLVTTQPINIEDDYYISNDSDDPKNTHLIEYLDTSYYKANTSELLKVVILPLNEIDEAYYNTTTDIVFVNFIVKNENISSFIQKLTSAMGYSIDISQYTYNKEALVSSNSESWYLRIFEMPYPILIVSSISLFILLLIDFKNNRKEIIIRKMHGNENNFIFKKIFLKSIIFNLSSIVITIILCFVFFVHNVGVLGQRFILFIIPSFAILITIFIGLMILFYFILKYHSSTSLVKKNQDHQSLFYLSIFVKLVVVAIFSVSLVTNIQNFSSSYRLYQTISKDEFAISQTLVSLILDSNGVEIDRNKVIYEMIEKYQLKFRNMRDYGFIAMNHEFLREHHSDYSKDFIDLEMTQSSNGYNYRIPFITMNNVSVSDYTFIDENNEDIDLSKYSEANWVLAPVSYKDEISKNGIKCFDTCEIVYYKNDVHISDLSTSLKNDVLENKLIYVMNQYSADYDYSIGITVQRDVEGKLPLAFQEALNSISSEIGLSNITALNGQDIYTTKKTELLEYGTYLFAQIFIAFFLISVFAFTYITVYFDYKGKELVTKYLLGVAFERRYLHLFISLIFSYLIEISLLYLLYYKNVTIGLARYIDPNFFLPYTAIVFLIEFTIVILFINHFQKRKASVILKGENV